jgi:pimeloyl-ACP methyl ester carboxylesterase
VADLTSCRPDAEKPLRRTAIGVAVFLALCCGACGGPGEGPVVIFLDGAGWYSGSGSVRQGLRKAGYRGQFDTFSWSAFLGPAHDHLITAGLHSVAGRLAGRIQSIRENDPKGSIHLIGLSAGNALILSALEMLPADVHVDNVVLLSPTISARHDLRIAMKRVNRHLYATSSPHDAIITKLLVNADGLGGPAAGDTGFLMPTDGNIETIEAYRRVFHLPWKPSYAGFGWNGSHTSVTNSDFIAAVIAPRILSHDPYPLDRSLADRARRSPPPETTE